MDRIRKRRESAPLYDELPDDNRSNDIHRVEERLLISAAIGSLTPEERIAVVLTHFNDLTEQQAAKVVGWTPGKFKYRLGKARRIMAMVIEGSTTRSLPGYTHHPKIFQRRV